MLREEAVTGAFCDGANERIVAEELTPPKNGGQPANANGGQLRAPEIQVSGQKAIAVWHAIRQIETTGGLGFCVSSL